MKITAFSKDISRTIAKESKRFFAMSIITVLGVTMFSGLKASCTDLRKSADVFFDRQNLHDFNIASTLGLTDDDVEALLEVDGVKEAEGIYSESVLALTGGQSVSVSMRTLSKTGIDEPYVTDGRLPETADEAAVTQEFINDTGLSIGDSFSIEETLETDEETGETEDPSFKNTEYTISGIVIDVTSIDNPDGNTSFRSNGTSDMNVFILPEAVTSDVYTSVVLTLDGTSEMFCYDSEYENTISDFKDFLESEIKSQREEARYDQVVSEAEAELADAEAEAEAELDDAYQELVDGEQEFQSSLAEAEAELNSAAQQLTDAQQQIDDGWEQLKAGEQELTLQEQAANEQFAAAWAQIDEQRRLLDEGMAAFESQTSIEEINNGYTELENAKETLAKAEDEVYYEIFLQEEELNSQIETVNANIASADSQIQNISAALGEYWPAEEWNAFVSAAQASASDGSISYEAELAALSAALNALPEEILSSAGEYINSVPYLASGLAELYSAKAQLDAGMAQLEESQAAAEQEFAKQWVQIDEQEKLLDDAKASYDSLQNGYSQLEAGISKLEKIEFNAREQIASGWAEIETKRQSLNQYESTVANGWAEYEEGLRQYEEGKAEGEAELADGWAEYEEGKAEAEAELADAREQIADIEMATWYIQDRSSLNGYTNISSDADSIETLGTIFPIVFLTVAILISLTTITRMVDEDRSYIGTYMALGFRPAETKRKYLYYSMTAGIIGSVIGTVCAFVMLPYILFSIFDTMYLLPSYILTFVPSVGILGPLIFIGGIMLVTEYACTRKMRHKPATLMRPKAPKAGTRIFLEQIKFFWSRLSFLSKVTARNVFRYKKRLLMTVSGIAGCTALLLLGFSVKDSVHDLMPGQYGRVFSYDVMAVASEGENDSLLSYIDGDSDVESYINGEITSATLSFNDSEKLSVTLMVIPDGDDFGSYITLYDLSGKELSLKEDSIFVTRNAGDVLGFEDGDPVDLQLMDLQQAELPVTSIVENYLGNYVYMTQSTFEKYFEEYDPNAALINLSDSCPDQQAYSDAISEREGIVSCTSTQELTEDFSSAFELINIVVYVVIVMSAALAFVVLFTLQTTNISEREREIATIKVLGFYKPEVHSYINRETYILTSMGIILGMPLGYLFAQSLSVLLNLPSIYLPSSLHPVSYVYAALLDIAFAVIVNLMTNRSLDRLDPAVALKSVE